MRLRRLDLTRYGKFTDHQIDFGEPSGPDFHVVYGPNEAGKSTAFNAYLDLLYGIEKSSPYGFKHPYATMRIGGALEFANGIREFVRLKRQGAGSLLDGREQPLAETAITQELGGIGRAAYRDMFSLDDGTLEKGGEDISRSKGDLGQLLFSATAGLAALSANLVAIKDKSEQFYRPGASKIELAELRKRIADLKTERDTIDVSSAAFAQLVRESERAEQQYNEATAERAALHQKATGLRRSLSLMPRFARLKELRQSVSALADLPEAPPGWAVEVTNLEPEEGTLLYRKQQSDALISELETTLAERPGDALGAICVQLSERLRDVSVRKEGADKDLPNRRRTLIDHDKKITGLLARLGRENESDPGRLLLPVTVSGRLQQLMQDWSGIKTRDEAASNELKDCRERLDMAKADLPASAGDCGDAAKRSLAFGNLKVIADEIRKVGYGGAIRSARRRLETETQARFERLAALRPWAGDPESLQFLPVPDASILAGWREKTKSLDATIMRRLDDAERAETERQLLVADIQARTGAGVLTDAEAASVRASREGAWAELRRRLDEPSADAFERALRADDLVTSGRLAHVSEAAELRLAIQKLAQTETGKKRAEDLAAMARNELSRIHVEICAVFEPLSLPFDAARWMPDLDSWLAQRDRALEAVASCRVVSAELHALEEDAEQARERLAAAIAAIGLSGESVDLDSLLTMADQAYGAEEQSVAARKTIRKIETELARRTKDSEAAAAAYATWQTDWRSVCADTWLGEHGGSPEPKVVQEALDALSDLSTALALRSETTDRIEKMEADQHRYEEEVRAIAADLGIEGVSVDLTWLYDQASQCLAAAAERVRELAAARDALRTAEAAARTLKEEVDQHQARKQEITEALKVETLRDAAIRLREIERRANIRAQVDEEEHEILATLGSGTIDEAEAAFKGIDRIQLESELEEASGQLEQEDERWKELYAAHKAAKQRVEAVGSDDRAALLDERRQTTLIEIEEGALRYLKLAAGVMATNRALWLYRERHRSSMLEQASEAFRLVTRGAYAGLATQPEGVGEILIAVQADGVSKQADQLSKGTRFQLYLALRVAGYREFAGTRPAVPFIADDIMETFDNERAEEAFRLFAAMAEVGQVIYLTHHPHLCEIARKVCPSGRFHELT